MKARYFNAANTAIEVTIEPGDRLANYTVPPGDSTFPTKALIFLDPPTDESTQLLALIDHGIVPHPDPFDAGGSAAPRLSVSSAQALIQLSRMPYSGPVAPDAKNLAEATEHLVAQSQDYELKTWFARADRWYIDNPNVQKIGGALSVSADAILAAFESAAKIEQ